MDSATKAGGWKNTKEFYSGILDLDELLGP